MKIIIGHSTFSRKNPDFRQGLDDRQERYVVGVYSDTQVFMESPVFVQPDPQEKKRGRKRKYPNLIETNPLPVKVSELGKCVVEGVSLV